MHSFLILISRKKIRDFFIIFIFKTKKTREKNVNFCTKNQIRIFVIFGGKIQTWKNVNFCTKNQIRIFVIFGGKIRIWKIVNFCIKFFFSILQKNKNVCDILSTCTRIDYALLQSPYYAGGGGIVLILDMWSMTLPSIVSMTTSIIVLESLFTHPCTNEALHFKSTLKTPLKFRAIDYLSI